MTVDPFIETFNIDLGIRALIALHVEFQHRGERRSGLRQKFGNTIGFLVGIIAYDKILFGIVHRQTAAHIIERDLEVAGANF